MPSESKNVPGNAMVDVTDAAITAYTKDLSYDKMVALLSLPKRFDKDLKPQSKESKDGEIIKFCNIWARKAQQWHPDSDFSLARDHGHQMLIVALSELIKSGNRYGKPGKEAKHGKWSTTSSKKGTSPLGPTGARASIAASPAESAAVSLSASNITLPEGKGQKSKEQKPQTPTHSFLLAPALLRHRLSQPGRGKTQVYETEIRGSRE